MARRYCPGTGLGYQELSQDTHHDAFIKVGEKVMVTKGKYENYIGEYQGINNSEMAIVKLLQGETVYVPQTSLIKLNPPGNLNWYTFMGGFLANYWPYFMLQILHKSSNQTLMIMILKSRLETFLLSK